MDICTQDASWEDPGDSHLGGNEGRRIGKMRIKGKCDEVATEGSRNVNLGQPFRDGLN